MGEKTAVRTREKWVKCKSHCLYIDCARSFLPKHDEGKYSA